jgi:hypothetical protein
MIHLFDKVYITYAETYEGPSGAARLPESFIRVIDRGLSFIYNRDYEKNLIGYGKNLNELLSNFLDDEDFFTKIQDEILSGKSPKVIIYADEFSMLQFLIKWWKTVFPNITSEGAYALYKCYADSETLRTVRNNNFLDISVKSNKENFDKFCKTYWNEEENIFKQKFKEYSPFNISSKFVNTCSIEFLIMDYMVSGKICDSLVKKINHLYNKKFVYEITNLIKFAQHAIYILGFTDSILKEGCLLDGKSLAPYLSSSSKYRVIHDSLIQYNIKSLDYIDVNYEVQKVCKDLLELEYESLKTFGMDSNASKLDNPCVYYYAENGRHLDPKTILENELNFKSSVFSDLIIKNRLNPYLIPAFKNLIEARGLDDSLVKEFARG